MRKILSLTLFIAFIFIACSDSRTSSTSDPLFSSSCNWRSISARQGSTINLVNTNGTCLLFNSEITFTNAGGSFRISINNNSTIFSSNSSSGIRGTKVITNEGRWQWQTEDIAQDTYREEIITLSGANSNPGNQNLNCTLRNIILRSGQTPSTVSFAGTCAISGDIISWSGPNNNRSTSINRSNRELINDNGLPEIGNRVSVFADDRRWEWRQIIASLTELNIIEID